jgi:putative transposase
VTARFEIPDGWGVQAFRFTLDPTESQNRALARHFGARRKAYNWTVATIKADLSAYRDTGVRTDKPSLRVLRKRWNQVKSEVCVNAETGSRGGRNARKRPTPTGSTPRWMRTGTGKPAVPAPALVNGSGSRG